MTDIQAKGKFNKKTEDGSWKYQRPGENPQAGGAQIKKWDSAKKNSTDTTKTVAPINGAKEMKNVTNMLNNVSKPKKA